MRHSNGNLILGGVTLAFAILVIFVWIPLDTQTGLIEKVRRQVTIGDALAPTIAASFLAIGGLMLVLFERNADDQPRVSSQDVLFGLALVASVILSVLVMRYSGPATISIWNLLSGGEAEYRLLRDTAPWKYIGFLLGGTMMITLLVSLVEGRVRARTLLIAFVSVSVMAAIYDLPFDDLLLPPNGDV
ncbi:hypothetical protein [Falsiruegeria mediterranea]|uniref:Tripartite tricarboxylate transporter TctB family protein n=1 Tax=Falsiruegeria mediterranea M17 TaxID=1200281 RepID=A0A2R8C7V7_9RHOB|nr:hypothetical protein [Falsiruegeria mediterranea]SPJ28505.1 hypothetical protein TRM7615_02004 [Falsiruegeria mediterranea M17]